MRNVMLRRSTETAQNANPRQRHLLIRNPLIPILIFLVIATLLAADGGGLYFVIGAALTGVVAALIARRWVRFLADRVREVAGRA